MQEREQGAQQVCSRMVSMGKDLVSIQVGQVYHKIPQMKRIKIFNRFFTDFGAFPIAYFDKKEYDTKECNIM